mgnify:CR=1 FL=1
MTTLIQNYSSALSTEAMYIQRCLAEVGEASFLWSDPNASAFDTFDYIKPNLFITHFKYLTKDMVKYLSANKNISMALNVSGAQQEEIDMIESMVNDSKVDVPLLFTNEYGKRLSVKSLKLEGVYPAADIFIPRMPTPNYEMDTCIFSLTNNELVKEVAGKEDNYHIASLHPQDQSGYADMHIDVTSAVSFYEKYKKIVLADDVNIVTSQLLFDSLLRCQSINIKVGEGQQSELDKILGTLFVESSEDGDLGQILKNQVRTRHNCFRRAARLLRLLKSQEVSSKLERAGEKI